MMQFNNVAHTGVYDVKYQIQYDVHNTIYTVTSM